MGVWQPQIGVKLLQPTFRTQQRGQRQFPLAAMFEHLRPARRGRDQDFIRDPRLRLSFEERIDGLGHQLRRFAGGNQEDAAGHQIFVSLPC